MSIDIQTANDLRERIHGIREQIVETAPGAAADTHHLDAHTPAWRDGYQTAIADVLRLAEDFASIGRPAKRKGRISPVCRALLFGAASDRSGRAGELPCREFAECMRPVSATRSLR